MTTASTGRLRHRLRAELAAIAARLPARDETFDPGLAGSDFLDVAQSVERQELASLGVSRLAERARRLRQALERVDEGDYGVCTECGEAIPARRLLAVPDATTCVACQERLERDGVLEAVR
jgi:phage/conjugal plasmid C-4 type zinc finger TraR family protein